jgi:hypothetical protein
MTIGVTGRQADVVFTSDLDRIADQLSSFNPSLGPQAPPTFPDVPSLRPGAGEKWVPVGYPDVGLSLYAFPSEDPASNDTSVARVDIVSYDAPVGAFESGDFSTSTTTVSIVLEDGTDFTVVVEGKSPQEALVIAARFGEIVAQMPPEIRRLIGEIGSIILKDFEGGAAAVGINPDIPRSDSGSLTPENLFLIVDIPELIDPAGSGSEYAMDVIFHELGHVVGHANPNGTDGPVFEDLKADWLAAMAADGATVSGYATSSPGEDFAETYSLWYRVRSGQITGDQAEVIEAIFSNRFEFLDNYAPAVATLEPEHRKNTFPNRKLEPRRVDVQTIIERPEDPFR